MRISFRLKTILGIATIESLFLSILILNSLTILANSHLNEVTRRAQNLADVFSYAVSDALLSLDLSTLNSLSDQLLTSGEILKVEIANNEMTLVNKEQAESVYSTTNDSTGMVIALSDIKVGDTTFGKVELTLDATYVDLVVAKARRQSIQIAIIEILLVALASLLLGFYLTKHLNALRREIKATKTGELVNETVSIPNDEIGDTIQAFHELKEQLQQSEDNKCLVISQVGQLADELGKKETWLKAITNQLIDGIIAFDSQGSIHYANNTASDLLGYEQGELQGLAIFDLSFDEHQRKRIKQFMAYGRKHQKRESITRHRNEVVYRQDGKPVSMSLTLNYTHIHEQDYFVITLGEVSWRRHIEQQIQLSDAIKTGILESSLSAVVAIDDQDKIIEFNPSAETMFGYSRQEAMGSQMSNLIIPERFREAHLMGMKHYAETGEGPVLKKRIQRTAIDAQNREFPIEIAITPILENENGIFTAVIDDISQRQDTTRRLEAAKEDADRASVEKSRFLASMSHEIRTPLNVILGMVDLLQGTPLSEPQKQFTVSAENAGRNLLDMINDVLDLSKIEAGKMEPSLTSFNPTQVLEESVLLFRQRCWTKNLRLFTFIGNEIPKTVTMDISFYRQIITNLLSNAVNYTDQGHITVRLVVQRIHGIVHLIIDIEDTGTGMSKDDQRLVFEEFTQVHASTPKTMKGTGLGLVICRQLANLVGGDIALRSEQGVGSTFSFQFPLVTEPTSGVTYPLQGKCVVLVSQDEHWRNHYEHQLGVWGAFTCHYSDLLVNGSAKPDAVLIDLSEGIAPVSESIQCWMDEHQLELPIVALIEENSTQIQMIDKRYEFLSQPVMHDKLIVTLSNTGERKGAVIDEAMLDRQGEELSQVDMHASNLNNILLVEDSEANRLIVNSYLTAAGYSVHEVEDGDEALTFLSRESVDLILMDMRMPNLGGVEATRRIRAEHLADQTPIIALTAHALVEVRDECLEVGMQDFLTKPIEKSVLLTTLDQWLNKDPYSPQPEIESEVIQSSDLSSFPLFSPQAIDQLIADTSVSAVKKMIDVFEKEMKRRSLMIGQCIKEEDFEQLEVSVHAIKSSAKTFGGDRLSEVARLSEDACRNNDILTGVAHAQGVQTLIDQTLVELTRSDFYVES